MMLGPERVERACAELEGRLCEPGGEFTDSATILGRATALARLGLMMLASDHPPLGSLMAGARTVPGLLEGMLMRPSVRAEISRQLAARGRGELPSERRATFDTALAALAEPTAAAEADAAADADGSWSPSVLGPDEPNPLDWAMLEMIRAICAGHGRPSVRIVEAGARERGALLEAEAILEETVPSLWHATRDHTRAIVLLDDPPFGSCTLRTLPGVTMLSTELLQDPADLAEAILHEAVHDKLADLCAYLPVLPVGYSDDTSPRLLCPPWREDQAFAGGGWPVWVVLSAAHVYVHLIVLRGRNDVEASRPTGVDATAHERADFLTAGLLRPDVAQSLREKGGAIAAWLRASFEAWEAVATGEA